MAEGRYAKACEKFEAADKLAVGVGTRFNWADCLEREGKLASAWGLFQDVAARTKLLGDDRREAVARARAARLEPRLAKLTVRATRRPGLVLRLDGARLDLATLGVAFPTDLGQHVLTASAPGCATLELKVGVQAEAEAIELVVPALEPIVAAPTQRAPASEETPSGSRIPTVPTALYVTAGLSAVGLGLGTYFGLSMLSKRSELAGICPSGAGCSKAEIQHYQDTRSAATSARALSALGFSLAALSLGASAVIKLSKATEPESAAVTLATSITPQSGFANVTTVW